MNIEVTEMTKEELRAEWLKKCQLLINSAFELSAVWEHLDMEDNGETSKDYPFTESFDSECYKFSSWLQGLEEKWGK